MNQPQVLVRISALFAAILMTVVMVGGQLGLAEHYAAQAAQADAVLAAKQAAQAARVAQRAGSAAAAGSRT